MTDSTRNQTDIQVDVPASVQREGEASSAFLAEYFATVSSAIGDRRGERTENTITPSSPTGLGYSIEGLIPEPRSGFVDFNNIWGHLGLNDGRQIQGTPERPALTPSSLRSEPPTTSFVPRLVNTPEVQRAPQPSEPYTGPRTSNTNPRVRIEVNRDGIPTAFNDGKQRWTSADGNNWTIGGIENSSGPYRMRHGRPSIDEQGNFTFRDTEYGATTTVRRDGQSTRTMTTAGGEQYSVTMNRGDVTEFSDSNGRWQRSQQPGAQGMYTWTNERRSGEPRTGRVELNEYGEFRFTSLRQDGTKEVQQQQSAERARIQELQNELTRRYGIQFAEAGERRTDDKYTSEEISYLNGVPTLRELETLRSVMERSPHVDYRGVRVWFTAESTGANHFGHYNNDGARHSCASNCQSTGRVVSSPGELVITPRARLQTEGFRGLEGTLLHELAHHEQGYVFGHSRNSWGTGDQSRAEIAREIASMGWVPSDLETTDAYGRTVHSRAVLQDRTGGFWTYNSNREVWQRVVGGVMRNGILQGGHPSTRPEQMISNNLMRERALVRPGTHYFDAPDENHTEILGLLRMGAYATGPNARTLFETSEQTYRIAQAFDQRYLDRTMPGHMRASDGRIVLDTPANRGRKLAEEMRWSIESSRQGNQRRRPQG